MPPLTPTISRETPFKIDLPDSQLSYLQKKLSLTTLPDELPESGLDYGVPLSDMQRLLARWSEGYDWRKHEAELNADLPQFTRGIDVAGFGTLEIHYVHKKSITNTLKQVLAFSGPGLFIEVRKILPLLVETSKDHPSFHVVALSLPGYGFSEAPRNKGFSLAQYAEVGHKLMLALGYDEYVTQGGDWGSLITRKMASLYGPKYHKAWHTNLPIRPLLFLSHIISSLPIPFLEYTPREKSGLENTLRYYTQGSAYFAVQSKEPQTLGYSLADSPSGLLAWIYDKLRRVSDNYPWDDDEVLTWVSLHLFSRAGPTAALRIYYEVVRSFPEGSSILTMEERTSIPVGHSYFPKEIISLPSRWFSSPYLVFESQHESGGHFAAYEKPVELVDDLRKMFGRGGGAFNVVSSSDGYLSPS
ncbi:Alpha/Beta hydrolase protein [Collybia nuda]|uniref:Alpha/Beta hydrolase protein n=1 Tax=Collybia nuda TaxID=64659 RepID=A0A9P5YGS5_9AGAR|nr:Alpha/Beta hydrolase protein [Collybia nuda]